MKFTLSSPWLTSGLLALMLISAASTFASDMSAPGDDVSVRQSQFVADGQANLPAENASPREKRDKVNSSPRISPAQAAELVRHTTGGQVMGVTTLRTQNRVIYRVKVLSADRMRLVRVDGNTGEILHP